MSTETAKQKIVREMGAAIAQGDWEATYALLHSIRNISDPEERAGILNSLLVMPGHELHQEIARQIQRLRSPSSVPYIRRVLEDDFRMLDYTSSDPGVIAKWFSHALAKINTPESIALIKEYAASGNSEVAEEMAYRLRRLNA